MKKTILLLFAAGLVCVSGFAGADEPGMFSVFDSSTLERQVYGQNKALNLNIGPFNLGRTTAFFGMDSLSDDSNRYLTSGVRWQNDGSDLLPLTLGVTNTVARGSKIGSQTLWQAGFRLPSDDLWYLPSLTFEADQLAGSSASGAFGRAVIFGFGHDYGRGRYHVGYFRTGPGYHPWGSSMGAGERGFSLSGDYDLNNRWRLKNTAFLRRDVTADTGEYGFIDNWQFVGTASGANVRPWRLKGQFGTRRVATGYSHAPFAVELAPKSQDWLNWRFDSAVGWYKGDVITPRDIPVAGSLWRVSASRNFDLAGLSTSFEPSFAIGGSRYADQSIGSRTGLVFSFPDLLDDVSLGVDYLSPGWGPVQSQGNLRVMLNISGNAGTILPWLGSITQWRGSWLDL